MELDDPCLRFAFHVALREDSCFLSREDCFEQGPNLHEPHGIENCRRGSHIGDDGDEGAGERQAEGGDLQALRMRAAPSFLSLHWL